jgi:hypothetical protein
MRVRVVTEGGNVVGYQVAEERTSAPGEFRCSLTAGPGQKLHELEIGDDFALVPSPEEIHKKLGAQLTKRAAA